MQKLLQELGIQKCRCNYYYPNKETNLCNCGRDLDGHTDEAKESPKKFWTEQWNPNENENLTKNDGLTDSYGDVIFINETDEPSKYIRASHKTETKRIAEVLFGANYWNLKPPKLIISVTGGAELKAGGGMSKNMIQIICRGLVKAASTTDGWITTGGTYAGIMKYVGEAVHEFAVSKEKQVLLGIANWTTVRNNEILRKMGSKEFAEPVEYEMKPKKSQADKSQLLDPNHTHFLLIDNAQLNQTGGDINFRARFESEISKGPATGLKPIPVVLVVIEGGPNTIKCVLESLINNIPCVVIDKSGRFANIFCHVYRLLETESQNKKELEFNPKLRSEVSEMIQKEFPGKDHKKLLSQVESIFEAKYRHLISIFELDPNRNAEELDEAVLKAFLQANECHKMAKLCLSWNRVDIAKNHIFNDSFSGEISIFDDLMFEAIMKNRVEFVDMFLQNNFDMRSFLDDRVLLRLYNTISDNHYIIALMMKITNLVGTKIEFYHLGNFLNVLIDDLFCHKYANYIPQSTPIKYDDPEHEVFIFCLLLGHFDLAKIFWSIGKNQISTALIAVRILKSLAEYLDELAIRFEEIANEFEDLACEALRQSYSIDDLKTEILLIRRIEEFSGITTLQLAISAECMKFVSEPAFQSLLAKLWYENVSPFTSQWKIYATVYLPFLAPYFISFKGDQSKQDKAKSAFRDAAVKILDRIKSPKIENPQEAILKAVNATNMKMKNVFIDDIKKSINLKRRQIEMEKEQYYKLDIFDSKPPADYFQKLSYFMKSPLVKFFHSLAFFIGFIFLFAYVMLCDFYPLYISQTRYPSTSISIPEIALIIWAGTYGIEELRQFLTSENRYMKAKWKNYTNDFLNLNTAFALLLFFIGVILRFIPRYGTYLAARIVLSVDIIFWFIRSLYAYSFIKSIGPKLVMIRKMTWQLISYFMIILAAIFGFGVCVQTLITPNKPASMEVFGNIWARSFYTLQRNFYFRDDVYNPPSDISVCEPNSNNNYECTDNTGSQVTLAVFVFYSLLGTLLLTLLIAIFSKTYESIEESSDQIWKFQRYALVYEYFHKSYFPAPLCLIFYVKIAIKLIVHFILRLLFSKEAIVKNETLSFLYMQCKIKQSGFYYEFGTAEEKHQLVKWESYVVSEVLFKKERELKASNTYKLEQNMKRLESIELKYNIMLTAHKEAKRKLQEAEAHLANLFSSDRVHSIPKKQTPRSIETIPEEEKKAARKDSRLVVSPLNIDEKEKKKSEKPDKRKPSSESEKLADSSQKIEVFTNPWSIAVDNYAPIIYTAKSVLTNLNADIDLMSYPVKQRPPFDYNNYDRKYKIDRNSVVVYTVENGLPLNPFGRTGVSGRGSLFYWGPNNGIEAVFTRWNNIGGNVEPILEVLITTRHDSGEIFLPNVLIKNFSHFDVETSRYLIKTCFDELSLAKDPINKEKLQRLILNGKLISRYMVKSKLNTDNAWIEFTVINYHDPEPDLFHKLELNNRNPDKLSWIEISKVIEQTSYPIAKYLTQILDLRRRNS